jgi:hypothetical protein
MQLTEGAISVTAVCTLLNVGVISVKRVSTSLNEGAVPVITVCTPLHEGAVFAQNSLHATEQHTRAVRCQQREGGC